MLATDQIRENFFLVHEYCQFLDQNLEQCSEKLSQGTDKRASYRPSSLSHREVITILIGNFRY